MTGRSEIYQLRKRLDSTLNRAPASTVDIEVQSDFAKYFCILVSGFLENVLLLYSSNSHRNEVHLRSRSL